MLHSEKKAISELTSVQSAHHMRANLNSIYAAWLEYGDHESDYHDADVKFTVKTIDAFLREIDKIKSSTMHPVMEQALKGIRPD